MECRNCHHYLNDGYRYCPRCGAPSTVWPGAGAPWLRRPAAVGGLALLLTAWLVALQRQLWQPAHPPTKPNPPGGSLQVARLPSIKERSLVESTDRNSASQTRSTHHSVHASTVTIEPKRPSLRTHATVSPHRQLAFASRQKVTELGTHNRRSAEARAFDRQGGETPATPRPSRRLAALRAGAAMRSPSGIGYMSFARSTERPVLRWADMPSTGRSTVGRSPWAQTAVAARFHPRPERQLPSRRADLLVNVSSRPYGAKTFVYYNAGRLLGTTPLPVQFDRPGRYRLTFWTPSLRRRATKIVAVTGRGRQWVSATMGSSRELALLGE
jgi:hypothetical protein